MIGKEQKAIVIPMLVTREAFVALNDAASKMGKTVGAIVQEALEEKLERILKEESERRKGEEKWKLAFSTAY